MKKIIVIAMVLVAVGLVACAGSSNSKAADFISRFDAKVGEFEAAVKAGDAAKMTAIQGDITAMQTEAASFKESDFTQADKDKMTAIATRLATSMMGSLGSSLGDALKGLGDTSTATDAAAPATTTP